jgi:hypothetical protein
MGEELYTNYLKSAKTAPKGKNLSNTMRTIVWITQTENTVLKFNKLVFLKFINVFFVYKDKRNK